MEGSAKTRDGDAAVAGISVLQQTGRAEGTARNVGSTIDEIEDIAARLGQMFRRLDEQTVAMKDQLHLRIEPDFSAPWIKESHQAWRKGNAAARDLAARSG